MITIDGFTWRLGNQLFQIAAAINLAEENMDKVFFPDWEYAKYFKNEGYFFNKDIDFDGTPNTIWRERQDQFQRIPYHRNMAINGYFQSEKYFENSKRLIKKLFEIKDEYNSVVPKSDKQTCSVHVRRTDYLSQPENFTILDMKNYYVAALNEINRKYGYVRYFVYSDDIEWCYDNIGCYLDMEIDCSSSEIQDFSRMKSCDHNIIANSSYSWWAAYLNDNPNKTVIAPKTWFGPNLNSFNTDFLCPSDWIRI